MAEYDDDIRRIEVGLSFLNGQDTAAAVDFANALKASTEFFKNFNPKDITDAFTQAVSKINVQQEERTRAQRMQTGGSYASPPAVQPPSTASYNQQLGNYEQMSISSLLGQQTLPGLENVAAGAFTEMSPATQAAQLAQQTMSMGMRLRMSMGGLNQKLSVMSHLGHGGGMGNIFGAGGQGASGASATPGPDEFAQMSNLGAAGSLAKTLATDTLMAGLVGTMYGVGRSTLSGAVHGATDPITAAVGMLSDPYSMQMAGAQLGYARGGSFLGLPISNPFSGQATSEGLRQSLNTIGLAFRSGINLQQAQQIQQAATGYGFSGAMGSNVTDNLLAPLFQKFGMNPQQIMQNFGAGLRSGIQTVSQLRASLEGLGQAAQAASMTLSDTSNAVASANQAVQSIGGTPQTGIAYGTQFQSITGLPANVGGQLITNPFVQSMIALDTGVMPSLQGTLGTPTLMGGVTQSVAMLTKLFGNSFQPKTQTMYSPTGQPLYTQTESSQELGRALIANYLGLDVGQVQRLQQYAGAQSWATSLIGEANKYSSQVGPAAHLNDSTIQAALAKYGYNTTSMGAPIRGSIHPDIITTHHTLPAGAQVIGSNSSTDTFTLKMADGSIQTLSMSGMQAGYGGQGAKEIQTELAAMQHATGKAGGSQVYWNQIQSQISKSGIWTKGGAEKEIAKLNRIADPRTRASRLTSDISHQMQNAYQGTGSGGTTIQIALKGQAAKMFSANPSSVTIQANSGTGPTLNYQAATPQGLSPLTGYTPFDSGDYESY